MLGNGSPIMSSFAAAIGLDAPVEVCRAPGACSLVLSLVFALSVTLQTDFGAKQVEDALNLSVCCAVNMTWCS